MCGEAFWAPQYLKMRPVRLSLVVVGAVPGDDSYEALDGEWWALPSQAAPSLRSDAK
jgi:hypothetical protein